MEYFAFFGLPAAFILDEEALRQRFLQNSKKYHPDFHTLESEDKQAEILELSTLNNLAYRTLADFDQRMKYILEQTGTLQEEGKNEIPQDFLMDMMEINEALMELEFDFDENSWRAAKEKANTLEEELLAAVKPILENWNEKNGDAKELEAVRDFFLKKRYILRILENLDKFAPASKEA